MMTRHSFLLALIALFPLVFAVGCKDTRMGQVTGTVTYKGKPVSPGLIYFYPESGPMAFGGLDESGHFTLMTKEPGDGALAGRHKVCVMPFLPAAADIGPGKPFYDPDPANIPKRYRDSTTTTLTAEVIGGQLNECTFELND